MNTDGCTNACRVPFCGDGIVTGNEDCDDGNADERDACTKDCKRTNGQPCNDSDQCASELCLKGYCVRNGVCGDGVLDPHLGELCDDGNQVNTDGCTNTCRVPVCGDGIVSGQEACDAGVFFQTPRPTCTNACLRTDGQLCNGSDQCASELCLKGYCVRNGVCGDGVLDPHLGEFCDDGNRTFPDRCSRACLLGLGEQCSADAQCDSTLCLNGRCTERDVCGNTLREAGEACDDGNKDDLDTCTNACLRTDGQPCDGSDQCASELCLNGYCVRNGVCGDGVLDPHLGEFCDQGRANSNVIANRCRTNCHTATLGDCVVDSGEECDDCNLVNGDGCSDDGRKELVAQSIVLEIPQPIIHPSPFAAALLPAPPAEHLNDSGPEAVALMAGGAAAGYAWIRRRRR